MHTWCVYLCKQKDMSSTNKMTDQQAGNVGKMIGQGWNIANSTIGNAYTRKRNAFDSNALSSVYGDSSADPLFGNIGINKKAKDLTDNLRNETFNSNARNASALATDISENNNIHSLVQGPTGGQKAAATLQKVGSGAAKGAEYGSVAGPYGMAIGAIAGAVAGGVSGVLSNVRGDKRLDKMNRAIAYSNAAKEQGILTSVDNYNNRKLNEFDANYVADGGFVNMIDQQFDVQDNIRRSNLDKHNILRGMTRNNFNGLLNMNANRYADGGGISNAKRTVKGITEFNAGGSHEENPNGGVPQGVDNDGVPNLVEEGEVKISDVTGKDNQYILSNRIAIDEETARNFGIDKKHVGLTFADAFKKAYSPFKDRQGNPEVRNEIAHLINSFQQAQESVKQKQEMEQRMAMLQRLTPEQISMLEQMSSGREPEPTQQEQPMQMGPDVTAQQAPQQIQPQQPDPMAMQQEQMMSQDPQMDMGEGMPMACGGWVRKYSLGGVLANRYRRANKYDDGGPYNDEYTVEDAQRELADDVENETFRPKRIPLSSLLNLSYDQPELRPRASSAASPSSTTGATGYSYYHGDEIAEMEALERSLNQQLADLAGRGQTGSDEYNALREQMIQVAGKRAQLQRARNYKDLGIQSLERMSNMRSAPVGAAVAKMLGKDKWHLNSNEYDDLTKEGLARSMVSAPIVGERYRPQYLDPNFGNNQLLSSTAQMIRNAAMNSAGNRSMANAYAQQAFNAANAQRGQSLYNGMLQNEQMRKAAYDFNNALDQANRNAVMQADQLNSNHTFDAYGRMAQNHQDVNLFNKNTDSNLYDNAFQQMGNFGQDAFNRAISYKMAANGLYGNNSQQAV